MTSMEITEKILRETIPQYIDSAKSYAQLSIGALALSVAFREKVLGADAPRRPGRLLLGSWLCLLVSIAASAWYQYVAVKLIAFRMYEAAYQTEYPRGVTPRFPLSYGILWPGIWYGVMVAFFFLGAVTLVAASAQQVDWKRK